MGFGKKITKTCIYEVKRQNNYNKAIWDRECKKAETKHKKANEKLEKYHNNEIKLTDKQIEKVHEDLNYKPKTPKKVKYEQKQKERKYWNSLSFGDKVGHVFLGDNWYFIKNWNKKEN